MGWMQRWFNIDGGEQKAALSVSPQERIWLEIFGGLATKSGASVNWKTALQVSAVFGCARVIADGLSQVPLKLFRETADGKSRTPAKDHPMYQLLYRRPNEWQTSFDYRQTLALHLVFTGHHYSFINRLGGKILELIPFEPQDVTVKRNVDGSRRYEVRSADGSSTQTFPQEAIWHIQGASWNGWLGLEPVKLAREAIGLSLSTEESHARMHSNGARTGGILSVEGNLDEKQYTKLKEWIERDYEGAEKTGKTMIVDRGAKFMTNAITGVDSQHLETRRYQVEEICRFMRVMPIMVGFSDKASTYASAEQMFLAHVVHTLSPWYERIEQSIDCFLLSDSDRAAGVYSKFIDQGLLRGALKDTSDFLTKLTAGGILTRNEARSRLEENPLDGLDEPLIPISSSPTAKQPVEPDPKPAATET